MVPVEFTELTTDVRPKDFIDELKPHLSAKYAPLQPNGNGNQGVYLASISDTLADILLAKIGKPGTFFKNVALTEEGKKKMRPKRLSKGALISGLLKSSNLSKLDAAKESLNLTSE